MAPQLLMAQVRLAFATPRINTGRFCTKFVRLEVHRRKTCGDNSRVVSVL